MDQSGVWRKCGSCKKEIRFGAIYQVCSVSTCSKMVFCSVDCWDLHVPVMNHKSAWAEENRAPNAVQEGEPRSPRRIVVSSGGASAPAQNGELEVLIVASKLKSYVKDRHGLNTSAEVMDALSNLVRQLADAACERARSEGRKTLMDRDFPPRI